MLVTAWREVEPGFRVPLEAYTEGHLIRRHVPHGSRFRPVWWVWRYGPWHKGERLTWASGMRVRYCSCRRNAQKLRRDNLPKWDPAAPVVEFPDEPEEPREPAEDEVAWQEHGRREALEDAAFGWRDE